jgi:hypothetical protein
MMNSPFNGETFQRIWLKHFNNGNISISFNSLKQIKLYKPSNSLAYVMWARNANAGQDQNICDGSLATLTASGGDTYLWSTGETTLFINVTPNTTTLYTVTAFVGAESDTDNVVFNVNEIPIVNAGTDQTICAGEIITLSASGSSSYLWSTGVTSASIKVSPNNTATYSVTVTQNGCSDSDDVLVIVNPSPTTNAGNEVSIFDGESTTLTTFGGDTYLWSTGETTASITVSQMQQQPMP